MNLKLKVILISVVLFVSGCSQKKEEVLVNTNQNKMIENISNKEVDNIFEEKAKQLDVNSKTLKAICKHESLNNPYAINVNKNKNNKRNDFVGSYKFKLDVEADLFMNTVLEPMNLNYDIGYCQINSQHLDENLVNVDLLKIEKNIEKAALIYKYGVDYCKSKKAKDLLECSLSMYNTGKINTVSSIGRAYANKVKKELAKM